MGIARQFLSYFFSPLAGALLFLACLKAVEIHQMEKKEKEFIQHKLFSLF
jgi:hypothetical protein